MGMTAAAAEPSRLVDFIKGHGTGNDFVILPDPHGQVELSAELVARICDRRSGIGADGVLRVVRCSAEPAAAAHVDAAEWFMDYRNADGSIAEMCGNGARVFAQFLISEGWADSGFVFASRAGTHQATREADGDITVEVGVAVPGPVGPDPIVRVGPHEWQGDAWWMPNPHAVVFVDDLDEAGTLAQAPVVIAADRFPDGQNVEFVVDTSADHQHPSARMRVYERGVGETLSCGTGACAVALSVRARHGLTQPGSVVVYVPGGRLRVDVCEDGRIALGGPAVLVGRGAFEAGWWER